MRQILLAGLPPLGGIAFSVDRLMMLICDVTNLRELHIRLNLPEQKPA